MIKTIPQAIDDIAVSLGASPSAEIPTVAQALENVYSALGGDRTDLDTLVVSEIIDLVAPLIQGGGGGGDFELKNITYRLTIAEPKNSAGSMSVAMPSIMDDVVTGGYITDIEFTSTDTYKDIVCPVVLYKAPNTIANAWIPSFVGASIDMEVTPTITGDAELSENFALIINGDCMITLAIIVGGAN